MADEKPYVHERDSEATGFSRTLVRQGLQLTRGDTQILQVNVGLLCNQTCGHCHLNAGPGKTEVMTRQTADQIADWAGRVPFETIDITGGAPEMNLDIVYLVETFAALAPKLTFRSNLSALNSGGWEYLMDLLKGLKAIIVALGLPLGRNRVHVTDMTGRSARGNPIATADHCYTCTAGAGFT
jgi:sulfatase maturation enzyme AslB (radical SAM superfamily)